MAQRYDPASGQTFLERSTTDFSITKWLSKWPRKEKIGRYVNPMGAPSLTSMCLRRLVQQSSKLGPDSLINVPWNPLGKQLWELIRKAGRDSVQVWQAFAAAYHNGEPGFNAQNIQSPAIPQGALMQLLPYVAAPNLEWLTIVTLTKVSLSPGDWMNLGKMSNLGALLVYEDGPPFTLNSRIFRAWAEHAKDEGAFPELRLLVIRGYGRAYRFSEPDCLDYLADLPKLRAVHIDLTGKANRAMEDKGMPWRKAYMDKDCENYRADCIRTPNRAHLDLRLSTWSDKAYVAYDLNTSATWAGPELLAKPTLSILVGDREDKGMRFCNNSECRGWYERDIDPAGPRRDDDGPEDAANNTEKKKKKKKKKKKREVKAGKKRSLGEFFADYWM